MMHVTEHQHEAISTNEDLSEPLQNPADEPMKKTTNNNILQRRRTERKRVSFQPTIRCRVIQPHWEMSEEMRSSTWFTPEDFHEMRTDMKNTIKAFRRLSASPRPGLSRRSSYNDAEDIGLCIRGLEHMSSSDVSKSRQQEQLAVVDAVLGLQELLKKLPEKDLPTSQALAHSYAQVTSAALQRALEAAAQDEREENQARRKSSLW